MISLNSIPFFAFDVFHFRTKKKALIDVTETGTEAAAATVLSLNRDGASKRFRADKPFLFFVVDSNTRAFIFSGRFAKPTASAAHVTG